MALRHDAQGFLQGDAIDLGRMLASLNGIRADVRAIQRALGVAARTRSAGAGATAGGTPPSSTNSAGAGRTGTPVPQATLLPRATPATPLGRDSRGRFIRREPVRTEGAVTPGQRANRGHADPAQAGGRDGRGRFTGADGSPGSGEAPSEGMFRSFFDRLSGVIDGSSLENADPAVKAFQEVAQPLARGYGALTGNREEKRKESWFRRIYSSLTGFRKDESVFNRAANRSLRNLEEAPTGGAGGGGQGGFAGLIAGITSRIIPLLGLLFTKLLLLPIAGAIGAWKVGQWIGEKLYAWMDKAGINTIIFDAFDGAKTYIGKGWDGAVSAFKTMGEGIGKAWDSIVSLFTRAYEALKSLPVIGPAIQLAERAAANAAKAAVAATTAVKNAPKDFQQGVKEQTDPIRYAPPVLDASGRNVNDPRRLDRGAAVNSDGRMMNDPRRLDAQPLGSLAPATSVAQRAGRFVGGVRKLLGVDGKKRMYENADGSTETRSGGSVSWRNNNPGNLKFEHAGSADATVNTKRTKAQALKSAQANYDGVVDLDQWGNAIFSTEEAGRTAKAKLLTGKHGGKTIEEMLPKYAVNDYSGKANHAAYAAGIYKTAEGQGVDLRGKKIGDLNPQEMNALLDGMKKVEGFKIGTVTGGPEVSAKPMPVAPAIVMPVQTAYAAAPKAPTFSAPPPIADAPPVINPLATGADGKKQISVVLPAQDVGQDVKDWRVAHIATGGIGGR